MTLRSVKDLLSVLGPNARALAEKRFVEAGMLASGAPLEDAFLRLNGDAYIDCLLDCQDTYDAAIENCQTDECRAGAAFALRSCKRDCKNSG